MLNSFKKNKKGILLMIFSSIFACVGQLFWKLGAQGRMIYFVLGFFIYAVGGLVMITAYKYGKLSVLQPILSLNYALSILLAVFVLKEKITTLKCIGVLTIIFGVLLIAGGDVD